jgi:hypothetical protein
VEGRCYRKSHLGLRSQYCDEWALISGLEVIAKMLLLEAYIYIYIYIYIYKFLFADKNCVNDVGGYIIHMENIRFVC